MMESQHEPIDWERIWAAIWRSGRGGYLHPVHHRDPIPLTTLLGIERQKEALVQNTARLIAGAPANHALLWGSRGTGKSSLIKALLNEFGTAGLRLIQFERDDLHQLPQVVDAIRTQPFAFIIFCDDLSFAEGESHFRGLKSLLEGSIELPPAHVKIYATSNRRHLVPERMADNLASQMVGEELHLSDAIEETIALSDRFGLQLAFHPNTQNDYLAMVDHYLAAAGYTPEQQQALHPLALRYSYERGTRSGRTAHQFFNTLTPPQ